ncbi:RNase H domain-containing protein [Trichonephila clavipes]|nr:RNase H domain-containing protein [Trichonephila clavipes]
MDWPAYSLYFKAIEPVCDMLGQRIVARQPPPTYLPELRNALIDESWCNIPQDQIDNLILSMPRRSLYEEGIQPLTMRFEVISYRYFNKIKSFDFFNRTSSIILNWTSNQRLKRDSPLIHMCKRSFIHFNVDISTPFNCITPIESFNHVEFREDLLTSTPKHRSYPKLLRQLALEVINDIPDQALIICTHDSRSDTGRAGSSFFSNTPGNDVRISIRNT